MSQTIGLTRLSYSRVWHQISASTPHPTLSTQPSVTPPSLGRLASRIAVLLMGKNKPTWDPSTDCGDYVVVTNCAALHVTGRKMWQKTYYRHTTRPGSLRSVTMDVLMAKHGGAEVLMVFWTLALSSSAKVLRVMARAASQAASKRPTSFSTAARPSGKVQVQEASTRGRPSRST
ncbi:hypothetical protein BN1723_002756 [Verticillium longisporum]|uniref:Uncharacterized protein n=1 Tax=Verticillium longisporum TaxID=100787 RepID=A0A0G4LHZ1_VERLO|nr:hypothetical protein BN1723_002756 [Verticillium longisporum]